jgi:tRNA1Val (adenine37-N6)-methyltransferase
MPNPFFRFKEFMVRQDRCSMKVTTDACLFGALLAEKLKSKSGHCLDIGTGTGLLPLMICQLAPALTWDALELETRAAQQATENVTTSPWEHRIKVIQTDANYFRSENNYDFIISNPPFYENEWKPDDRGKMMAHHNSGLLPDDLLRCIGLNLSVSGYAMLLYSYKNWPRLEKQIPLNGLSVHEVITVKNFENREGFRVIVTVSKLPCRNIHHEELIIWEKPGQYSRKFIELLQPYYLKL